MAYTCPKCGKKSPIQWCAKHHFFTDTPAKVHPTMRKQVMCGVCGLKGRHKKDCPLR